MSKTNQHGGKREGAGRKALTPDEPTKIVTVRLPQSQYDWLAKQGNGAEVIRHLIQQAMDTQDQ